MRSLVGRLRSNDGMLHFGVGACPARIPSDFSPRHPLVLNDNKLCDEVMVLTLNLLSRRLARHMVHSHGLPGVFAGLLDPAARPQLLLWLAEVHGCWLIVKSKNQKFWQKVVARSPFHQIVVQKVPFVAG